MYAVKCGKSSYMGSRLWNETEEDRHLVHLTERGKYNFRSQDLS